jgi:uncharacterized membrane protein
MTLPGNGRVRILHPLFVHLHIAFLLMAFIAMYTWLFRGLATSVFEDRIYRFARANTWAGVVTVALSMVAGIRDGLFGTVAQFSSTRVGGWLFVKVVLATVLLVNYAVFLYQSGKKPRYLQEDGRRMAWCLATQLLGIVTVAAITTIGTMLVFYQDVLPAFPSPLR